MLGKTQEEMTGVEKNKKNFQEQRKKATTKQDVQVRKRKFIKEVIKT